MGDQATGLLSPWLREKRLKMAGPYLKGRVLDYGCGVGALAPMCKPDAYLGIDVDRTMLEIARRKHPQFNFVSEVSEAEKFDTITALAVIEHVPDPVALLRKFKRMLKPKGHIVLTTPHPSSEWLHTLGAKIGLFSREASEEHQQLINYEHMQELGAKSGLVLEKNRRFLFGANQLFVLRSP